MNAITIDIYLNYLSSISVCYYITSLIIIVGAGLYTKKLANGILLGYVFLVLTVTVFARETLVGANYQITPFWSYHYSEFYLQIIANIILFVPLGIMLGNLAFAKVLLTGFCLSFCIEILQLFTHRGLFEFDDIIHNTLGTLVGFFIYKSIIYIMNNKKSMV